MIEITVNNRHIQIKYPGTIDWKILEWEDQANLSKNLLKKLDKINIYIKHKNNCLFKKDLLFDNKKYLGGKAVLRCIGRETTTWRIVFVTFQALTWANEMSLDVKPK